MNTERANRVADRGDEASNACRHCHAIDIGSPLPCRHCGSVTPDMFDVGELEAPNGPPNHDHFELCSTCFRGGVDRKRSEWMHAAGYRRGAK